MKLVLDTDALWNEALLTALGDARVLGRIEDGSVEVVLPAVAYAERLRHIRRNGHDVDRWHDRLEAAGIRIEAFTSEEAERLPRLAEDDAAWNAHGRDFLVAAHVRDGREGVTNDTGPAWAHVPSITPAAATQAIRDILSL